MRFFHRPLLATTLACVSVLGATGPATAAPVDSATGPRATIGSAPVCSHGNAKPGDASERKLTRATLCLVNRARTKRGLRPLRLNRRLSAAARAHSRDMVRKHYFDHVSRSGSDVVDRVTRSGYLGGGGSWVVGENLAWGAGSRSTPVEIMQAWMHSAGHRANILQPRFREMGIGVIFDTPTSTSMTGGTYTTTFGARG